MAARAAILLLALAAACSDDEAPAKMAAPPAPTGHAVAFEDIAAAGGVRFRMDYLPGEQGANFKINLYDHGSGVALGDIDGDGDDDIYFLNQMGANALYRNDGDGTFEDITKAAGPLALADRISVSALFNDLDGDGDQDLYVTTTRGGNAYFRNLGGCRFEDATKEAGLEWVGHSQGATAFDADGDGDLDLFLTNTAGWTTGFKPGGKYYAGVESLVRVIESPTELNVFWRNRGDGTFEKATEEAGLGGAGWGGDTAVFDHDEDGDLDLFVANMFGGCALYRNDGRGRFEDVTRETLGRTPWGAVGAKVLDCDSDGRLDLFVVDMHSDMWTTFDVDLAKVEPKRKYEAFYCLIPPTAPGASYSSPLFDTRFGDRSARVFFGNGLYRSAGGGRFEEVSDRAGVETFWPWGVATGDFDNDGHEDAFLPSGMGYPWAYWGSPLLMNNGDGTFVDRGAPAGINPPPGGPFLKERIGGKEATRSSRSAAVADLDGDGRLDLVVNNFNDAPHVYRNRSPGRGFIAFRLRATKGHPDAVGALVRLHAGGATRVRQVQAAGGYLAQSSKTVHFGLGILPGVDRVVIRWPSGTVQTIDAPETGRVHDVTEPAE